MSRKGKLYLVPAWLDEHNPPAQLPAATLDAVYKLKHFIVERAKTARHFLKAIGYPHQLDTVEMIELDKHREDDPAALLYACEQGMDMALISEAGVPAVADPGGNIVAEAHNKNIEVVPLIGPSSILLALMASGMNGQHFAFHGYLPREEALLSRQIKDLEQQSAATNITQIFIETPYRNDRLLAALLKTLKNDTRLCIAINLCAPQQKIVSKPVFDWKKQSVTIGKHPAVFLIYSGKM